MEVKSVDGITMIGDYDKPDYIVIRGNDTEYIKQCHSNRNTSIFGEESLSMSVSVIIDGLIK